MWNADSSPGVLTKEIRSNWVGKGSRDLLFEILRPLDMSGTVGARKLKFGASKQNANISDDQELKSKPEV